MSNVDASPPRHLSFYLYFLNTIHLEKETKQTCFDKFKAISLSIYYELTIGSDFMEV